VSVFRVLEGEKNGLVLKVEVVELVDQVLESDLSRPSGRGSGNDRFQDPRGYGRNLTVFCRLALPDTELLLSLVHDCDPNLKDRQHCILGLAGDAGTEREQLGDKDHGLATACKFRELGVVPWTT
jgi:hypothetical protein